MKEKNSNKTEAREEIYDSLRQCAGAMGISWDVLRDWKAAGCPAFKPGNRVHKRELIDWLRERLASEKDEHLDSAIEGAWMALAEAERQLRDLLQASTFVQAIEVINGPMRTACNQLAEAIWEPVGNPDDCEFKLRSVETR